MKYFVHNSTRYLWRTEHLQLSTNRFNKVVAISMQRTFWKNRGKWCFSPPEQVTEKHYTGIQAEETEQSLELVQVLSEDLFLGRGTLGWEGAQLPKFLRLFSAEFKFAASRINVGNGKIFWTSKLIVFFDVGWFWWLSSMEERYSQLVLIKSLQRGKMKVPSVLNKVCLGFFWHC